MTSQHETSAARDDEFYDQLLDEVAEKLALGEPLDLDACFVRYPQYAEDLRRLLPAMQAMVELGSERVAK